MTTAKVLTAPRQEESVVAAARAAGAERVDLHELAVGFDKRGHLTPRSERDAHRW